MSTSTPRALGSDGPPPAVVEAVRPRRVAGSLDCEVCDEVLAYVPSTRTVVALNASARAVWELCDGTRPVVQIAETLGRRFGVPGGALLGDVEGAVGELRRAGLIEP